MDRAYVDFQRLHVFQRSGAFFVVRVKKGVQLRRRCSHPADAGAGVISDHTVVLTTERSAQHYPDTLRRVRYHDVEHDRRLSFLTNNFDLPALTVALLYKSRWKVELFFKWIKQHLRIKAFYGTSENAVKTQIWTAVSVYVLVAILKKRLGLGPSLHQILQVLSVTLFEKTPIVRAFHDTPIQRFSKDPQISNQLIHSIYSRTVVTACILSLQAQRDEFVAINLANVDPKACFKALKGVGSSKLHGLAAVPPIMRIRREDGRFVSAQEVAQTLDESSNLAAMDWQEFEHLIREVFEKEFSSTGGEVKVTQASRDGGVDAIAFDPDPIRGGKIVIQAKRYANTVGVSAVRDLYGTVMNEGANKGVLVTTSDYGPDAYAFANGKPLILLNGANLLHMLEKHGHKARIDLQEARRIAMSQRAP